MDDLEIIIYLGDDWPMHHRRPMIEALARQAEGTARLVCVNPPVVPPIHCLVNRRRLWRHLAYPEPERLAPNLFLFTPRLWWHGEILALVGGRDRNRRSTADQLARVRRRIGPRARLTVAWLYHPDQSGLLGLAAEGFVVYECLHECQRRMSDGRFLPEAAQHEQEILKQAGLVLAGSRILFESRAGQHDRVCYHPNGVDEALFSRRRDLPAELAALPRPIVGYAGDLTVSLDGGLLLDAARACRAGSLVLIGPHDPLLKLDEIRRLRNVHCLGPRPHWELPAFIQHLDAAVLPLSLNEHLEKCNPPLLYECFAAGTPVVITDIPEARRLADAACVARSREDFVPKLLGAIAHRDHHRIERGREIARDHDWGAVTRKTLATLLQALEAKVEALPNTVSFPVIPTGTS